LHGGDVVATLVDLPTATRPKRSRAPVQVSRAIFPALPEDEYYWSDLIGLDVVNLQGEALGKVSDMMSNGPQSILRIRQLADPAAPEVRKRRAPGPVRGPVRQDRRPARQVDYPGLGSGLLTQIRLKRGPDAV
jgi:hypothetical protein